MDARRLLVRLGPALAAGAALTFSPAAASQAYAAPPPATTEVTQNFHQDPPPDPLLRLWARHLAYEKGYKAGYNSGLAAAYEEGVRRCITVSVTPRTPNTPNEPWSQSYSQGYGDGFPKGALEGSRQAKLACQKAHPGKPSPFER